MTRGNVSESNTARSELTRTLPTSLAGIVQALELEQAFLVTTANLEQLRLDAGVKSNVRLVAKKLRDLGWLLPTAQAGVWEFAPGSHAGAIGRGHPFTDVLAVLKARPELQAVLCLTSALWSHGLLDRSPDRPEVAVPTGVAVPVALKEAARVVSFKAELPTVPLRGVPTHALASVLVHVAARPTSVRSWGNVMAALPELLDLVRPGELQLELRGRPAAVATRLAYLIHGLNPELANTLKPGDHGKVWFGPRGPLKRHNQEFNIADTVLPLDPSDLLELAVAKTEPQ